MAFPSNPGPLVFFLSQVQLPPLHVSHRVASLAQGGQLFSCWLVSAECRVLAVMSPKPSLVSATGDKRSQRPRKVYMGFHSENGMLQCKSTDMEQCEEIRFTDHGIGCLSVGPESNADTKWLWIDLLDVELFIWKVKKHLSMKGGTQCLASLPWCSILPNQTQSSAVFVWATVCSMITPEFG